MCRDRRSRKGCSPLFRNGVTQNSPDFHHPGCLPRRAHIHGLPLYRSAPLSKAKGLSFVCCPRFSLVLNQQIQLLLCGLFSKEERQQLHNSIVRQKCQLFQKDFQYCDTSARKECSLGLASSISVCRAFPSFSASHNFCLVA